MKDIVASGSAGTRTFEGLINVAAQPASLAGFGDLTLITKAYLSGQVSTEASTRVAGDASIAANLSTELVARASADTAEASTRLAADNSIASGLSSELVARASADTSIAADLSSELVARASAITSEASDRVAGDVSLQNQIDFITNNTDAAAIDSLTEIVSAFQSADGDINGAITALASTATSGLSTEVARAESAEAVLTADLSSEASLRLELIGDIQTSNQSLETSIDNEASIRLAADESLATDLGLGNLGGETQWPQYINGFTDGWTNAAGRYFDAAEFNDFFGPANLANFTTFITLQDKDRAMTAEASLETSIDAESSINLVRDQAEESRAIAAEASLDAAKLNLAGGFMTGDINMNNNSIENVDYLSLSSFQVIAVNDAGPLSLSYNKIVMLAAPTDDGDATNKLYVDSADQSLATALSSEISRAEAAEDSLEIALSSEVSYLLANTDLTSIDSFAEVSDALAAQVSDFTAIYFKKATFTGLINGTNDQFTLASSVRGGSETVYLNGLLQEAGVDYTVAGDVITFTSVPQTGDKVVIYAVY